MEFRRRENEKPKRANEIMRLGLIIVLIGIVLACIAVVVRLIYINKNYGDEYARAVLMEQSSASRIIPSQRGNITDRNGIVLARSEKVYNTIIDPKVICSADYYLGPTLDGLVDIMGYDREELLTLIRENSNSSYLVYERNVDYEKVSAFNKLKSSKKLVVGVWFEEEYKRLYPYSTFASHVIGFATRDGGNNGLEQYYNDILTGTDGLQYGYYDSELNRVKNVKDARNGNTLVTTIDYNIQTVIEDKIKKFRNDPGCNNIGIIVMNPNNGEIYGMASNEEYDLNNPRSLDLWYTREEQEQMTPDEKLQIIYKNWRNFCISDTYEPGSTFKSLTVAAALDENAISASDTFNCEGHTYVGGWSIGCNKPEGHGNLTVTQSLMKSCNCALMAIAEKLGSAQFFKYQRNFGFGMQTGIDLTGEASGIVISKDKLNQTELATSSFGTTFNVTMVQIAAAYCSLINGGTYYTPHVVKKITSDDGTTLETFENREVRQTVSSTTSAFIRDALYETVQGGTATNAKLAGYLIGGKTGTAQKHPRNEKKYVVSFVGFAPVNDPQIMMYVVMDEIHDEELKGSSKPATGMTREVFNEILPYLGIYPDGDIEYVTDLELVNERDAMIAAEEELNWDFLPEGLGE